MAEVYFDLKRKLEELGYNNLLSEESVPLVECLLADLLQTTRSLQHYMDLCKEALLQRDSLLMEAEPYKCENAKLIQENNHLHKELMQSKEEYLKLCKNSNRRIKSLSEELLAKDGLISKLKHEVRDLSLRGLCTETSSSRNKSRKKNTSEPSKLCICSDEKTSNLEKNIVDLKNKVKSLEEKKDMYIDEINLLKNQVEHRDSEIIRLNVLLEGGRPLSAISKDCCNSNSGCKIEELYKQIHEMELSNDILRKEIETGLGKQHEAMLRALNLADKNKKLQEELQKVDALALQVEEDCNKRLSAMTNDIIYLQTRIEGLMLKNSELESQLSQQTTKTPLPSQEIQEMLNKALKEKNDLIVEVKELIQLNKNLQSKILNLSHLSQTFNVEDKVNNNNVKNNKICPTKDELQALLQDERKKYEKHIAEIENKLKETVDLLNNKLLKPYTDLNQESSNPSKSLFIRDLHNRLCESEQKLLMLKKENDDLKEKNNNRDKCENETYKDVINHLNTENTELSRENISLSQQLSKYQIIESSKNSHRDEYYKKEYNKIKNEYEKLTQEIHLLRKDKQEYNQRYKEAVESVGNMKRDLILKQKQIEQLQEENCSYKTTSRTGKASVDHLKDECNFLREQIKNMQNDIIKEKTIASQIKNIQIETERSHHEVQNELLGVQKKLSLSKDTIGTLEKKYKDLQSEIISLKNEKSNLIDNIRKLDQDRDRLVIELDHKTENTNILEQKIKSQNYEISKLQSEISEITRKLNTNKVSEHKLNDYESQIKFLNSEIARLTQQYDNAIIENKHLQNSLADANGALKITKIEYEKSRRDVDGLKQQLQHYVAEVRRIEELLSQKEAERSDMLEQFASLSVEANILENTNHSLETESASKSHQLQTYITKIQNLEATITDKDTLINSQSTRIATLTCKITALENEIKLVSEEKIILEQNMAYLKKMCNNLQSENVDKSKGLCETDSELKLYENRIKTLSSTKVKLEEEKNEISEKLMTTETLLSNARKEIVELKLALQDATSETKSLREHVNRLNFKEREIHETTFHDELELPLLLEETIHEVSREEDEDSSRYHEVHKRFSKYTHGGTF